MDSLYIVMPAYNEEQNIEAVVRQWYPKLEGKAVNSKLVIADSGSNDDTHKILTELKENGFNQIEILSDTNRFHGPKVIALYNFAIQNEIDYIFQTDSDGQTDPEEFDAFWNMRTNYSAIFGNRVVRGDGKNRAVIEKIVGILLRIYFGVKIPDANAPFRLMKTKCVNKYLYNLDSEYAIPNIMITTYFAYYKEKIVFKEVTFKPRNAGKNHTNYKMIFKIGFRSLREFAKLKKAMK